MTMDKSQLKKTARKFVSKYGYPSYSVEKITSILDDLGYTLVEFNHVSNSDDVLAIVEELRLEALVSNLKAFTYVSRDFRLMFLHENLSCEERNILFTHEMGHVLCGHFTDFALIGNDVIEEHEANEFSSYILSSKKSKRTFCALGVGCTAVMLALLCGVGLKLWLAPYISYHEAHALLDSGDLDSAHAAFLALGDYRDSADMALEVTYRQAQEMLDSGDLEGAHAAFLSLGDYCDSADMACEAIYRRAHTLLDEGSILTAVKMFESIPDYLDSTELANGLKYEYALTHKTVKNSTTYQYLCELVEIKYRGAIDLYRELYDWRIEVTAVNMSKSSRTSCELKKGSPLYIHYTLYGGAPGETTKISMKSAVNGQYLSTYSGVYAKGNADSSVYGWEKFARSGTLTVSFYDDEGNLLHVETVKVSE